MTHSLTPYFNFLLHRPGHMPNTTRLDTFNEHLCPSMILVPHPNQQHIASVREAPCVSGGYVA